MSTTILDLCDSLLGNLYNNDDNNNLENWKKNRTNPTKVLAMAIDNMSEDQRHFYNLIIENVSNQQKQIYMLAGLPGTGKSFLQTAINLFFQLQGKKILCLAPTNLIAYQQKGTTIHKKIESICNFLDIKRFNCDTLFIEKLIRNNYDNIRDMSLTELCRCISELPSQKKIFVPYLNSENLIIFIDEGTMVSSTLFSLLFSTYPKSKYIITYGPNQLPPPNGGSSSCDVCISREDSKRVLFYELISQKRFNSSFTEFVQYFSDVLSGKINSSTLEKLDKLEYFLKNVNIGGSLRDYHNLENDPKRILIVSTNAQRCKENAQRLEEEGEGPIFCVPTEMDPRLPPYYDLTSGIGIDKVLKIRKGVYCMIRVNELSRGLIKGQIIQIIDIKVDENNDVTEISAIKIDDNNQLICLEKMDIQTDYHDNNDQEDPLTVRQFPITLSYSLTAHSAQGKTLDCNVGIQLQHYDNTIPINSYFVAITRVRDARQLYMNVHPVYWLYYPFMKIKSVEDVVQMRKKLDTTTTTTPILIEYVKNFKMKKILDDDDDDNNPLQDINEIIKKICQTK